MEEEKDLQKLDSLIHHLRSSWEVLRADQPLNGFFRNLVEAQVAEDHFSFEQVKRCPPKHYSLYSF